MKEENKSDLSQQSGWERLNLPEFMRLDWAEHEDPECLKQRDVIFHVPSGSIMEICHENPKAEVFAQGKLIFRFGYVDSSGDKSFHWAVLLRCLGRDCIQEREELIKEFVKPACQWFCEEQDFLDSEDYFDDDDEDEDDDVDGFNY